jgi:hypothetical protein
MVDKSVDYFSDFYCSRPALVNYIRVGIDVALLFVLVFMVADNMRLATEDPRMALQMYEVPVYRKHGLEFEPIFEYIKERNYITDDSKFERFQNQSALVCAKAELHPMCMCFANSSYYEDVHNCLLQNPLPSQYSNWNIGSVSCALMLWFTASLATSVGTLPFITSYVAIGSDTTSLEQNRVVSWHRAVVILYVVITLAALVGPVILLESQFPGSETHLGAYGDVLMWSLLAIAFLSFYNYKTIFGYLWWTVVPSKTVHPQLGAEQLKLSVHNFILYVHLLVSAPAIALVLHINQNWTEYHTIVNTTLVLSTIFSVDAFSAEMANFWNARAKEDEAKELVNITSATRIVETKAAREIRVKKVNEMNMRLGLVRLFAWIVNAVMLLLLFSLAYPLAIDHQRTSSALFVVIVVMIAAVFLTPDLVREFTQRVSFNNIQFRLYGDFVLRCLVLFFTWRGSVVNRT